MLSVGDRRLYEVKGIGTLRLTGWSWRAATAEAGGRSWQITRRGTWLPVFQAADAAGRVVGEFSGRRPHRSATLRWANRDLVLQTDRLSQDRYVLLEADRKLALIHGKGSGKRPLNIAVNDTAEIDPGLLLFTAYVARALARKHRRQRRA
jgi:hypothetical protein